MKTNSIRLSALALAVAAATAGAEDHIAPKAAFADTSYETQRTPVYAINGDGIDEATGAHGVAHQYNMWMGKNSGNTGGAKFAKWFVVDLGAVSVFILDEADEMLDMGFQEDIDQIFKAIPEEHLTWMFSATMGREVQHIAESYLNDPVEVT